LTEICHVIGLAASSARSTATRLSPSDFSPMTHVSAETARLHRPEMPSFQCHGATSRYRRFRRPCRRTRCRLRDSGYDRLPMDSALRTRLDTLGDGLHRLRGADGRAVIVKRRRTAPRGFFAMEAHGLELLRATGTLRVPALHLVGDDVLVLEDLGSGQANHAAWERAGCNLARLHRHRAEHFGLDRDGWCGDSPQPNTLMNDGWRFFAECRLLPQARRARDGGRLPKPN